MANNSITGSNYGIALGTGFGDMTGSTFNDTLSGNTITNSSTDGIYLLMSSNCSIIENTVGGGQQGIVLSDSANNLLTGNNVSNNTQLGIQLVSSATGNILRNNTMVGNTYGFDDESVNYGINGELVIQIPQYSTNDVDASNTVNGKPIIYWVGQSAETVPLDASCIILVNCTDITVPEPESCRQLLRRATGLHKQLHHNWEHRARQ